MIDSVSIAYLHECLIYEPDTGTFTWKTRPRSHFETDAQHKLFNKLRAGHEAGWTNERGYRYIRLKNHKLKAHRIAWAMHYGAWPIRLIDHIDGSQGNNRIKNLRQASTCQNQWNVGPTRNNKTGFKGVSRRSCGGKYRAQIRVGGRSISLGDFDTPEAASLAYKNAERRLHAGFARIEAQK